jgi:hypothetical protein
MSSCGSTPAELLSLAANLNEWPNLGFLAVRVSLSPKPSTRKPEHFLTRCSDECPFKAKGKFDHLVGTGGQPCFAESGNALVSPSVGQMQPPISRPPCMNDDDHRTTAGNKHAEQPFVRSVPTRHQDPKWSGVQDPMHGSPKRPAPTFAPHRAARRRIPIPR